MRLFLSLLCRETAECLDCLSSLSYNIVGRKRRFPPLTLFGIYNKYKRNEVRIMGKFFSDSEWTYAPCTYVSENTFVGREPRTRRCRHTRRLGTVSRSRCGKDITTRSPATTGLADRLRQSAPPDARKRICQQLYRHCIQRMHLHVEFVVHPHVRQIRLACVQFSEYAQQLLFSSAR